MPSLPLDMPTATNPGIAPDTASASIGVPALMHRGGHAGKMRAHVKRGSKRGRNYRAGHGRGHAPLRRG